MSYAIGIDFGSHSSCVAVVRNGQAETIPNDMGNRVTASAIGFNEKEELIGDPAVQQFPKNAANTVLNVKRLLGADDFESEIVQDDIADGLFPCKVVADKDGAPVFEVGYKGETATFSPEKISSMILAKMRDTAEKFLGTEVKDAVIGVPYWFKTPEKNALERAANDCGLQVMRFVNESAASAMAYNFDQPSSDNNDRTVLVFDFGGAELDVALLTADARGMMSIRGSTSATTTGGSKFTKVIADFARKDFKRKAKSMKDLLGKNTKAEYRMLSAAEEAKHALSASKSAALELEHLADEKDYSGTMSRERFEELSEAIFEEMLEVIEELFDEEQEDYHGYVKHDITDVVICGGASKIPHVQQLVQNHFQGLMTEQGDTFIPVRFHGGLAEFGRDVIQDESVAIGAAIQADLLMQNRIHDARRIAKLEKEGQKGPETEKLNIAAAKCVQKDTLALSVGVADATGNFVPVLKRGTPVPATLTRVFASTSDEDALELFQGEQSSAQANALIGKIRLPAPATKGEHNIEFSISNDGALRVKADATLVATIARKGTEKNHKDAAGVSFEALLSNDAVDANVKVAGKARSVNNLCVADYFQVRNLGDAYERIKAVFRESAEKGEQFTDEMQNILNVCAAAWDAANDGELEGTELKDKIAEIQALSAKFLFW